MSNLESINATNLADFVYDFDGVRLYDLFKDRKVAAGGALMPIEPPGKKRSKMRFFGLPTFADCYEKWLSSKKDW